MRESTEQRVGERPALSRERQQRSPKNDRVWHVCEIKRILIWLVSVLFGVDQNILHGNHVTCFNYAYPVSIWQNKCHKRIT